MAYPHPLHLAMLVKRFVATGGAERYAVELTQRLVQRGVRVDLYCRQTDPALIKGIHRVIQVPERGRFSSVASALAFARDSRRLLQGQNYDVIHSHERGYGQDILTVHTFTWKAGTQGGSPLHRFLRYGLSPRHHLYSWLEKRQMQTPWLAPVSRVVAEDIARHYPESPHLRIISPGVDLEWFNPDYRHLHRARLRQGYGLADERLVVLFVGSEFRRKGLDDLIPAIAPGMELLVAGRGEALPHYRQLASDHGVAERVHFLGLVEDVRSCYAAADLVVLPSHREAFGMTVLEGMACGLPVVVRDGVGAAELVQHDFSGYRFSAPEELPGLLANLKDDTVRQRLGGAAAWVARSHAWEQMVDHYSALYETVRNHRTGGTT